MSKTALPEFGLRRPGPDEAAQGAVRPETLARQSRFSDGSLTRATFARLLLEDVAYQAAQRHRRLAPDPDQVARKLRTDHKMIAEMARAVRADLGAAAEEVTADEQAVAQVRTLWLLARRGKAITPDECAAVAAAWAALQGHLEEVELTLILAAFARELVEGGW